MQQHWLSAPIPRAKFFSAQDSVHLEDESGRVRLIGDVIQKERDREGGGLVTGMIMAALGMETPSGDFEVIDVCFAGMPDKLVLDSGPSNAKGKGKAEGDEDVDMQEGMDVVRASDHC